MFRTPTRPLLAAVLALTLVVGGCGGGGGGADDQVLQEYEIYVDAMNGSDANGNGSAQSPFASITVALGIAQSGDRIKAAPGIYDVGNGDQFPLMIPPGVELIGDPDTRGDDSIPTVIHGHGQVPGFNNMEAAVVPMHGSTVAGFTITNDHESIDPFVYDIAVFVNSADVRIERNTIRDTVDNAVRFYAGADDGVFRANVLKGNGTALNFRHGGMRTRVEYNKIVDNNSGVLLMTQDAPDLGGGVAGSAGKNVFAGNSSADVMLFAGGGAYLFAKDNYWDNNPPTTHVGINPGPPSGIDIWYASNDLINTDGAKKYLIIEFIPAPSFPLQPKP